MNFIFCKLKKLKKYETESLVALQEGISGDYPVEVLSVDARDVQADVVITVDTSDAPMDLETAAQILEGRFARQGYNTDAESNSFSPFFS